MTALSDTISSRIDFNPFGPEAEPFVGPLLGAIRIHDPATDETNVPTEDQRVTIMRACALLLAVYTEANTAALFAAADAVGQIDTRLANVQAWLTAADARLVALEAFQADVQTPG